MRRAAAAPLMAIDRASDSQPVPKRAGGEAGGDTQRTQAIFRRVANGLRFAAAPTFAAMAIVIGMEDRPFPALLCAGESFPALNGMVLMYSLMGIFHSKCWLELISV